MCAGPVLTEVAAMTERVADVLEVLDRAVCTGDRLTARHAAASLSELADRIETALLAATNELCVNWSRTA
jgi:hypothetical protein